MMHLNIDIDHFSTIRIRNDDHGNHDVYDHLGNNDAIGNLLGVHDQCNNDYHDHGKNDGGGDQITVTVMIVMTMVTVMVVIIMVTVMSTHAVGDLLGVHVVAPRELSLVAAPSSHLTNMIMIMTLGIIMRMMTEIINIVIIMMMMFLLLMTITSGGAPRPRHCGENEISFTPNLVGSER